MKTLIIIVTYNAMPWIDRCLSSVKEWDIFVVDNGSTDGTQQYIAEHYPEVIFRQSETNLGFGKANNIGLQYALDHGYDFVYLLNQDAWVFPGTIKKLMEQSRLHPEYGILSPVHIQGNMQHLDFVFGPCCCSYHTNKALVEDMYFGRPLQEAYEVEFVSAAHWLIPRACLKAVGGFSPAFPHYGEDNNYLHRATYMGLKTVVIPSVRAVHDRENRAPSVKKDMYMRNYIVPLIWLSNINEKKKCSRAISSLKAMIKNAVKYGSFAPIVYTIKLLSQYRRIVRCAKESRVGGAFLSIPA